MQSRSLQLGILTSLRRNRERLALTCGRDRLSYDELDAWATALSRRLPASAGEVTVGILAPSSLEYAAALCAVWKAGALAVPLQPQHPRAELEYILEDARPSIVFVHPDCVAQARALQGHGELVVIERLPGLSTVLSTDSSTDIPEIEATRGALMIYTSGTTSRPKGVVTTYAGLDFQVRTLRAAWNWSEHDRIANVLPLHHVHGVVNILSCALASGACCELYPRFDAASVWERLASDELTLFMAVPTVYSKLAQHWQSLAPTEQKRLSAGASRLRLMVSGSAALPLPLFEAWERLTGHRLLERYGMTEIGMALSNPYRGERRPKSVGFPLPGVHVRLVNEELQIKGPNVFREYWNKPELTRDSFTPDGWFKTGDLARRDDDGYYFILGRASQDILKSGGYKLSALEIEGTLLEHPDLAEVAVVGLADEVYGDRVAAACVWKTAEARSRHEADDYAAVKAWARSRLAHYKVPSTWLSTEALPRNAMGKVTKPAVRELFKN